MEIAIIEITTNGKLYILGEYNVLFPKGDAIIYGLNKHIKFSIVPAENFIYKTREQVKYFDYNGKHFTFESNNNDEIIKAAINTTFNYLVYKKIEPKTFNLTIVSDLESKNGEKYGFGSSSALISGVIKSILLYHDFEIDNLLVFKLSVLTQHNLNEFSSGGDLASAIYGGIIYYRRYNKEWVYENSKNIEIVEKKWPGLKIIELKSDLKFAAVWTKTSYKTKNLTYEITKKELKQAKRIVSSAYRNIINNNYLNLKKDIQKYQLWMENVLKQDELYTKELKLAVKITNKYHLASKISGAGGGDSIIFLYPSGFNFANLEKELEEHNLKLFHI